MKKISLTVFLLGASLAGAEAPPDFNIPVPATVDKKLIIEQYPDKPTQFFTPEAAMGICDSYKQLKTELIPSDESDPNIEAYFYVFCKFNYEEQEKKIYGLVQRPEWVELGTEITEKESYWGYFYRERPILEKLLKPKRELVELKTIKVVSVAVWGVGDVRTLPWKLLYSSTRVGGGHYPLLYDKFTDAKKFCEKIRVARAAKPENRLRWDRAKCQVFEDSKNGGFYWEIRTKNPLI